jgi:hypothetical protein
MRLIVAHKAFIHHLDTARGISLELLFGDSANSATADSLNRDLALSFLLIASLHFFHLLRKFLRCLCLRVGVNLCHLIENIF